MIDIGSFVNSMKDGLENFVFTEEGDINKFIGIENTQLDEKIFKISQPYLIDRIVSFLCIDKNNYGMENNAKSTPVGKPLLNKDLSAGRSPLYITYVKGMPLALRTKSK